MDFFWVAVFVEYGLYLDFIDQDGSHQIRKKNIRDMNGWGNHRIIDSTRSSGRYVPFLLAPVEG